jgi:hypothetical protein
MKAIKPPQCFASTISDHKSIFLAGSIEMGKAVDWQHEFTQAFTSKGPTSTTENNLLILNPRRDDWDSSWEQSKDHPEFRAQVEWELRAQEQADVIVMYFAPGTQSPITLLELGLFARSGKVICCCPKGFWRKGNVDVVCERYKVQVVEDLQELVIAAKARLRPASKE